MFWTTAAYAMGSGGQGGGEPSMFIQMAPLILMFVVFYFLLIRPQQKRAKEHRLMVEALRKGDEIITNSGFYGRIVETDPDFVVVDLGDSTVKITRASVGTVLNKAPAAPKKSKKAKKEESDDSDE